MPKVWRYSPHDETRIRQLCSTMQISALTAQVLVARGFSAEKDAIEFLDPKLMNLLDPEHLPGVSEAADIVVSALQDGRQITIYGDYDVDGVTATSLLWQCLKLENAHVDYYIPSRLEEGYGLNCTALEELHQENPDRLVISVDCGIASIAEAEHAKKLGLELIITDHHQMADELPSARCLVHPRLPGSEYGFDELCGAGVAFKLAWAVCKRLGDGTHATPAMRQFLTESVGLAALGTVADVVPLREENRILVRYGLKQLAESTSPGLLALKKISGLDEKPQLSAEDIGFGLAPRINAAGRLGQARLAVELLTTDNADRAHQLAIYLDKLNKDRRTVERRIFKQAKEQVEQHPEWAQMPALVLSDEDWHPGVIGIVANRVAEHFEKPAILIALDRKTGTGQGSGRSFANYNLYEGLTDSADCLLTYGGHQAAAGLKISIDQVDALRDRLAQHVGKNQLNLEDELEFFVDAEVRLADCTHRAIRELDKLGPFGQQNKRPLFAANQVEIVGDPKTMGEGDRHLSLRIKQYGTTLQAIAFGRGEWADQMAAHGDTISICFEPGINRFRGRESVQLQLKDWQPAEKEK